MDTLFDVAGRVVAITGSSGVICSRVARELATRSARVALLYHQNAAAVSLAGTIRDGGGTALAVQCDVRDVESTQRALRKILDEFGRVDALINGAGGNHPEATISEGRTFLDISVEKLRMVLDLNSLGTVIPSQTFLRQFAEQRRGNIINVTSMAAVRPLTNTPAYGLGKAAVQNFTEWLAVQVRIDFPDADIRVNAIAPGFLNTAQNHRLLYEEDDRTLTARGKSILDHTPLGRFGEPEELLGPILLLLSDAGRFMHGTTIVVDGGFSVYSGVGPLKRHLSMELESQGDGGPIV